MGFDCFFFLEFRHKITYIFFAVRARHLANECNGETWSQDVWRHTGSHEAILSSYPKLFRVSANINSCCVTDCYWYRFTTSISRVLISCSSRSTSSSCSSWSTSSSSWSRPPPADPVLLQFQQIHILGNPLLLGGTNLFLPGVREKSFSNGSLSWRNK